MSQFNLPQRDNSQTRKNSWPIRRGQVPRTALNHSANPLRPTLTSALRTSRNPIWMAVILAFFGPSAARSANYTWDGDQVTTGAQDGPGTWDTTTADFWNSLLQADQVWNNAAGDTAVFGAGSGAAGAITLVGPLSAGGLTFNAPGSGAYTLSGDSLTLTGTPVIAVNGSAVSATINDILTGTNGFTKTGAGILTLGAVESISGPITLSDGQTTLTGSATILNNASGISVGRSGSSITPNITGALPVQGAVLVLDDSQGTPVSNHLGTTRVTLNGGALFYNSTSTGSNSTVTNVTVNGQGWVAVNPGASGIAKLTITNLTVGPTSTVTFQSQTGTIGATSGPNGDVLISNINGVATTASSFIGGWATTETASGNADFAQYSTTAGVKATTYNRAKLSAAGATTDIVGPSGAADTVTVNTTVQALKYIPSANGNNITLNNGVTLTLSSGGLIFGGANGKIQNATSGSAFLTVGSGQTLYATVIGTGTYNIAVPLIDNGAAVSLVKGGPGQLITATPNTYTGSTYINAGTLTVGTGGTTANLGTGPIINNGALLINRGGLSISQLISGSGSVEITMPNAAATQTLANGSNSFTGTLTVDSGTTVAASKTAGSSSTSALGAVIPQRTIVVGGVAGVGAGTGAATLNLTATNVLTAAGASAATLPTISLNNGVLGATKYNAVGNLLLTNGSQVTSSALATSNYEGFQFLGNVTVSGNAPSTISNSTTARDHLLGGGTTTFDVGVTSGSGVDLTISAGLRDGSADYPGAGSLNKIGAGTVVLSGANAYSGTTSIGAGTLRVGDGTATGTLGGGAVTVTGGATLAFNRGDAALAVSNAISGAGVVSQIGQGTTTLSGTNSYTGPTTVNAGTLAISSTGSLANTAISVAPTASFRLAPGAGTINLGATTDPASGAIVTLNSGVGSTTGGALSLVDGAIGTVNLRQGATAGPGLILGGAGGPTNAPTLSFDIGSSLGSIDRLAVSNDVTVGQTGAAVNFVPLPGATFLATGDYTFLTAASGLGAGFSLASSTLTVGANTYILSLANSTATSEIVTITNGNAAPPNAYWTGVVDGNWNTSSGVGLSTNWIDPATSADPHQVPGSQTNVYFTAIPASALNTLLGSPVFTINSLNFTGAGTPAVSPVTISGGQLTINAAAVNGNLAQNGISVASGSGGHTINSNIVLGASQQWTNNSVNPLTVNGNISESSSGTALTLDGSGPIVLNGTNTFSGGANLIGGVVTLGSAGALGASGPIAFGGGVLQYTSASAAVDVSSRLSTSTAQNFVIDTNGQNVTFASPITSPLNTLTKLGAGRLALSAADAGSVTLSQGTLQVLTGGSIAGTLTLGDANTGNSDLTLDVEYPTATDFTTPILVANQGTGTVTFTTSATPKNTPIVTGQVTLEKGLTFKALPSTTNYINFKGPLTGTGDVTVTGGGTVYFTTASPGNSFTGNVYVTGAQTILQLANSNLAGSNQVPDTSIVNVATGSFLRVTNGATETIGGLVGGGTVQAHGTLTSSTLRIAEFGNELFSGVLANDNSVLNLIKSGSGTTVLTGTSTYSGYTTVNSGTLDLSSGGIIYNGPNNKTARLTIQSGGTLRVSNLDYGNSFTIGQLSSNTFEPTDVNPTADAPVPASAHLLLDGGTLELTGATDATPRGLIVSSYGGTLQVDNAATTLTFNTRDTSQDGGLSQDIWVWGNLNLSGPGSGVIQDKLIQGAGGLTVNGPGSWTIATASTYTGPTVVNGGQLIVTGSLATGSAVTVNSTGTLSGSGTINGPVTVNTGGTLAGASGTTLTLAGGLALADGSLSSFVLGTPNGSADPTQALIYVSAGGLTPPATGVHTINLAGVPQLGTYDLFSFTGSSPSLSNFVLGTLPNGGAFTYQLAIASGQLDLIVGTPGVAASWNLNSDGAYGVATNWNPQQSPNGIGAAATFGSSGGIIPAAVINNSAINVTVDGQYTVGMLAFDNPTTHYTLSDGGARTGLSFNNGANAAAISVLNGNHTIAANLTFADPQGALVTVTNSGDSLSIAGSVSNGGYPITVAGAGNVSFGGPITGAGSLNSTATGIVTLANTNSYSGGTTVTAGTLRTVADSALGAGPLTVGPASVAIGGDEPGVTSLAITDPAGSLRIAAGKTLTVTQSGGDTTFAGQLVLAAGTGSGLSATPGGALIKAGSSTLEINGAASLGQNSQLSVQDSGRLRLNLTSGTPSVGAGATVAVGADATLELDGTKSGLTDPTALLSPGPAANPALRAKVHNDGTLVVGNAAIASSTVQEVGAVYGAGTTTVSDGAALTVDRIQQSGLVIGDGSVLTLAPSNASGAPTSLLSAVGLGGSSLSSSGRLSPLSSLLAHRSSAIAGGLAGASSNSLGLGSGSLLPGTVAVPEPAALLLAWVAVVVLSVGGLYRFLGRRLKELSAWRATVVPQPVAFRGRPHIKAKWLLPRFDMRLPVIIFVLLTPAVVAGETDLAANRPAISSSSENDDTAANKANDGDRSTCWRADDEPESGPEWWQVDLGHNFDVSRVEITWPFDGARYRYTVQGSADAKQWRVLSDQRDNTLTTQLHTLKLSGANNVRHVRITVTGLEDGYWASISEVQVFGSSTSGRIEK